MCSTILSQQTWGSFPAEISWRVISADRRYVRITTTPLFSGIAEVNTFNTSTGAGAAGRGGTGGQGFSGQFGGGFGGTGGIGGTGGGIGGGFF